MAIYRLLLGAYANDAGPYPHPDEQRLLVWVAVTLAEGEVWVADLSGRIVGSIALASQQFPWSREWVLSSRWLYVLEKFRGRGTGKALLQAVVASADQKAAPLVLTAHGGNDVDWRDEFLGGLDGAAYAGGTFFRRPAP